MMSDPISELTTLSTSALLAEIGRRYRIRFGRVELLFHDGRPSPRVFVEHRVLRPTDDGEPRQPTRTEGGQP